MDSNSVSESNSVVAVVVTMILQKKKNKTFSFDPEYTAYEIEERLKVNNF